MPLAAIVRPIARRQSPHTKGTSAASKVPYACGDVLGASERGGRIMSGRARSRARLAAYPTGSTACVARHNVNDPTTPARPAAATIHPLKRSCRRAPPCVGACSPTSAPTIGIVKAWIGAGIFLTLCSPMSLNTTDILFVTCSWTLREMQMPPGSARDSSRAATLTPSPSRSPSLSTTSPIVMPMRNRI